MATEGVGHGGMTRKDIFLSAIYTPLIIVQLVLFMFFFHNHLGIDIVLYIGWGVWVVSVALAIAPIVILKRRGGVAKGDSYMKTTRIVDTGLYSVVRHPQYLGGLLFSVAMILVTQHWMCLAAGAGAIVPFYLSVLEEDKNLVNRYGDEYRDYMRRVPRLNILAGIYRASMSRRA